RGRASAPADRRNPRQGAGRGRAAARAPGLPAARRVGPRPAHGRRRRVRARPAQARDGRLRAAVGRDRRRHGAAVPGGGGRRLGARGRGSARRRSRGPARDPGRPPGGHRHARRSARVAGPMSRIPKDARFPTRVVHAGLEPDPAYGSVVPPIHQTSTYVQRAPGEFVDDFDYARSANPTRAALERALGELEGGLGTAFASGMAATHALLTAATEAGAHVILPSDLYGGTYRLVNKVLARFGLGYDLV